MKISKELSKLFKEAKSGCALSVSEADDFADALQQAVAENLKAAHELDCQRCSTLDNSYTCSKPDPDWLAEADKLLRGEK